MVIPRPRSVRSGPPRMTISALVLVLAVAGAAVAAQTRSAVAAPGPGSIVGVQSGRCVDVPNGSTTNGTQVQLYDCTGGTPQSWTYTSAKQLTVYGNKCLDANGQGTSPGTTVIIWDCNGQANQQWNITSAGTVTGQQSGLCLDATNAGTANGTRIILWTCNGQANQRWNVSTTPSSPPPTSTPPPGGRPCDIYAAGGTPCVAAHSTTRALFSAYGGNLYQVRRSSDNATRNIGLVSAGGYADAAAQDAFCSGTSCVITAVFDQSGRGNDLWYQGSAQVPGSTSSRPANATSESLTVGGARAYSLYINPGNSYWRDGHLTGVPTGSAPEGMYMVTSGTHVNSGCCFDYGNSETTRSADAAGAMDAINFSTSCWFGGCSGSGPWVQADLEWGLYPGGSQSWNPNQRAFTNRFVTATLKNNGTSRFAIKGSNAQSGGLYTLYDGSLPAGYSPMRKQGAIILGSGGDCCKPGGGANLSAGTFYEGAMVAGYPSDATENAVQADIVAAGYR
ncbi:ricin-type beta-trefoil lectin domain protein [Micromonospora sp. WMMC264]|nr:MULTISPECIES: arabinofuranosidase catalytic domain-containing protein [unclassified Micromonospora]MBQ1062495.1 ricin-type beta-trefoil lectin domain protein [Micromonospora sp. C41]MCK1804594.1 ricin-type beta-trefoil lectin domain protein [Micromonospora sp. R42106]MCK1830830.1 ricin-type beta-trefoil lectin domain protein [Micromonospora sp. R42003]MCK1847355.1 ricin-type beta-trefoil lectin domain protein [Micromonospora sp. R42004]MCM1015123.1 ricin-type beta-trefoil lectin domain prot